MQIGLSGLTGKQAPALRCFQCKGTLNLQGFHTLQLVSSPFYFPHPCTPSPGRRRLGSPGVPLRRSSSLPPGMVLGWCTATRQRGQAQAGQQQHGGCLSPAPQAMAPQAWCRAACTQLSPSAVPTDSSSAAWRL